MAECGSFDVVIIGGGAAGMAAALWCDELRLKSCLIEQREGLGGQLRWIHNPIRNYPAAEFRDGVDCLTHFESSLRERHFEFFANLEVFSILSAASHEILTSAGAFAGKAIIIATGVRRRELGVLGEADFRGRGILESGARDRRSVEGLEVAVVGGGDAALENALILAEFANKVYLIHRGRRFSARKEFVEAVAQNDKIEAVFDARVQMFGGEEELEFVEVSGNGNSTRRFDVSKAVIRVGVVPNSELLVNVAELDDRQYVKVDHLGRTSADGVYAIGDVANPVAPTIASAVGSAATAVKSIVELARISE